MNEIQRLIKQIRSKQTDADNLLIELERSLALRELAPEVFSYGESRKKPLISTHWEHNPAKGRAACVLKIHRNEQLVAIIPESDVPGCLKWNMPRTMK